MPPVYYTVRNNLARSESATTFVLIGEQTSRGLDLDVNTDLGGGAHMILNYGFARPRFDDAEDLSGKDAAFRARSTT